MKFSIRTVLAATLLIAVGIFTFKRWSSLETRRKEIRDVEVAITSQGYDGLRVAAQLEACKAAVNDTEIPSAAYRSAETNFRRLNPDKEFGRGK